MAVISRLASAPDPLPWVQWLSGKSVQLSLSPKLTSSCSCLHRAFTSVGRLDGTVKVTICDVWMFLHSVRSFATF